MYMNDSLASHLPEQQLFSRGVIRQAIHTGCFQWSSVELHELSGLERGYGVRTDTLNPFLSTLCCFDAFLHGWAHYYDSIQEMVRAFGM